MVFRGYLQKIELFLIQFIIFIFYSSSSMMFNKDPWEKLLKVSIISSLELYKLDSELEWELAIDKDLILLLQRELKDLENFPFISIVLEGQRSIVIKFPLKVSLYILVYY